MHTLLNELVLIFKISTYLLNEAIACFAAIGVNYSLNFLFIIDIENEQKCHR